MVASDPNSAESIALSVVIPTYRRLDYLGPLFDALTENVSHVPTSFEVILVDNDPAASAKDVPRPHFVRYVHEPNPGVANARNRGVAEARGIHIVFLDDDELPDSGWLAAFANCASQGAQAAFGPIDPVFDMPPPPELFASLDRVFSRRLKVADSGDISDLRAYLGTGNSMFLRDLLVSLGLPFDPAFDRGGEDVWLLRKLVDDLGVRLVWCEAAKVRERVPSARCTIKFLRNRRFRDGQLRCVVEAGTGGWRSVTRVGFWMAAGLAQVAISVPMALVTRAFAPERSVRWQLMAYGGAGKVLWWTKLNI